MSSDNPFEPNQRLLSERGSNAYGVGDSGQGGARGDDANNAFGTELTFQNFQHSSVNVSDSSKIGGGAILQEHAVVDFSEEHLPQNGPPINSAPEQSTTPSTLHLWNLQYYAPLFNVDTKDVLTRIVRSMVPFKFSFVETVRPNPDFYGPFWIATTLIFILAVAGNLYSYLVQPNRSDWHYDFNMVTVGAVAIYGYILAIPLLLWLGLKWLKVPMKLLETVCIYGYAMFVYIPVSIVCVIPVGIMQWILVCSAAALSGWFLVSNLMVPIKNASRTTPGIVILAIVGGFHIGLALLYRLYFFAKSV